MSTNTLQNAKRLTRAAALTAGLVMTWHQTAFAVGVNDECAYNAGRLTFLDFGPNGAPGTCRGVVDWNPYWGNFGWHDRADQFRNDGNTHNACIYEHENYRGGARLLYRGQMTEWFDAVDSNSWTRATVCPR